MKKDCYGNGKVIIRVVVVEVQIAGVVVIEVEVVGVVVIEVKVGGCYRS